MFDFRQGCERGEVIIRYIYECEVLVLLDTLKNTQPAELVLTFIVSSDLL